ncbi:MAG: magnesium transporter CorA family protein [Terrimicrobiaceae bacterium]|nr:magnesium transporter CorA family protein [Terrimicrobiaceae bacterium]
MNAATAMLDRPPGDANPPFPEEVPALRTFFRLADGRPHACEEQEAQIIAYNNPGPAEEAELLARFNIDSHTLQSSLDPEEISRLEFEPDHAAVIFKRPKSYCADDNFLLKVTSTGAFLYADLLVVIMPDDAPLFEGRPPFPVQSLQDVILRLLYQSISHFEGHLKAINMLSDSLEKRLAKSMENKYLLNMFALEKSLVYILNSLSSNSTLCEKLRLSASRLGFDGDQIGVLEDISIENKQCFRRAQIYSEVLGGLMDSRASIVSNNLNHLIKKFTIITIAIMLANLIVSIFSMNVKIPWQEHESLWPFFVINVLAAGSALAVLWLWRVRKW